MMIARRRSKQPSNKSLPQIAKAIKALEKRTIRDIVEIGKLLHEAEQQCEHGEYMKWMSQNFDFSHDSSLHYRNAYSLSRNPKCSDFARWNISVAGFYLIAATMNKGDVGAATAVIKAARKGRVSTNAASQIIHLYHQRRQSDADSPPADFAASHTASPVTLADEIDHVVDEGSDDPNKQKWQSNLRAWAEDTIATMAILTRDYLDLGFDAPSDLIELVNRATNAGKDFAARLDGSRSVSSSVKAKADAAAARSQSTHSENGHAD
jgi:hypothetical protein